MFSTTTLQRELPLLTAIKTGPCISVIMPFNPKMISKTQLNISLKNAARRVQEALYKNYTAKTCDALLNKLQHAISRLDYTTHKISLALYVSPDVEQLYYLDIDVHEKIMVDTSFEIRDIVRNKKDKHEFLLLCISGTYEKIYVGTDEKLSQIVSNTIEHVQRDLSEVAANFIDANTVKETRVKKFLLYIDNGLSLILKAYRFPLFIAGTEKILGYFKQVTKHQAHIAGFIPGNFDNATKAELQKLLPLQINNRTAIKKQYLHNMLKAAQANSQLVTGIHDVWMNANRMHKQLLVVEKDFYCPAFVTTNGETVFRNENDKNKLIAKDAVDDIIEKVLQRGGDIEFIDDLKDYNRIALIT